MIAASLLPSAGSGYFVIEMLTAQAPSDWSWRMQPMWHWGWGVVLMAVVFLVCGAVLFAGMAGMHWFDGKRQRPADSAMEILHGRFARGEIDKDEFEAKKKALAK